MTTELDSSEKILQILDYLGRELDPSILIGGWATQFRVGGEISYDIDLIIQSPGLRNKLRDTLSDFSETNHLSGGKKMRGSIRGVHVDAYLPHESVLGNRLQLSVAKLSEFTDTESLKGWQLLSVEAHLCTKFAALLDRPDSEKGAKDAREIWSLLETKPDPEEVAKVLLACSSVQQKQLPELLTEVFDLLADRAGLNKSSRRKLHDLRRMWVDALKLLLRPGEHPD